MSPARKRETSRYVQKQGHRLDYSVHVGAFDAVENICSDTCTFMGCTTVLREFQVPVGPLLQKRRGKR